MTLYALRPEPAHASKHQYTHTLRLCTRAARHPDNVCSGGGGGIDAPVRHDIQSWNTSGPYCRSTPCRKAVTSSCDRHYLLCPFIWFYGLSLRRRFLDASGGSSSTPWRAQTHSRLYRNVRCTYLSYGYVSGRASCHTHILHARTHILPDAMSGRVSGSAQWRRAGCVCVCVCVRACVRAGARARVVLACVKRHV